MTDPTAKPDHTSSASAPQERTQRRFSNVLGQWADQSGALLAKLVDAKPLAAAPDFSKDHFPDPRALFRRQIPALSRQLFGPRFGSASQLISKFIPLEAIEQWSDQLFDQAALFAQHISPIDEVLSLAEVDSVDALYALDATAQDALFEKIMNRNRMLLATEGALTGWAGIWGSVVDLPVVLVVGLRAIYQVAQCYGAPLDSATGQKIVYRVLSSSDLSVMTEKQALMLSLGTVQQFIAQGNIAALQGMVGSGTNTAYFEKLTQDLSQALNIHLRPQLLARVVPLAASATSAVYNVRLISAVGQMAKLAFADTVAAQPQPLLNQSSNAAEQKAAESTDLAESHVAAADAAKTSRAKTDTAQTDTAKTDTAKTDTAKTDAAAQTTEQDIKPASDDAIKMPVKRVRRQAKTASANETATGEVATETAAESVTDQPAATARAPRTTRAKKTVHKPVEPENKTQH